MCMPSIHSGFQLTLLVPLRIPVPLVSHQAPKEGVYIKGMFLEGAGWDFENGCLTEPEPMELIVPMPIMHFRPVSGRPFLSWQCLGL